MATKRLNAALTISNRYPAPMFFKLALWRRYFLLQEIVMMGFLFNHFTVTLSQ